MSIAETTLTRAETKLTVNLALASRMLSRDGHDDLNQGQASARLPGADRMLIKNFSRGFNEARPEDMILAPIDPEGPCDPLVPPELPLHQAIYAARSDVNAIVHSHAPYTLIFGATDLEIRPISHDGAFFTGRVPRFTETSHTVLDIDTGRAIARTLEQSPAVFLQNHGGVVVGKSIREVAILAQVFERACRMQLLAESARAAYHVSNEVDVKNKRDFIYGDLAMKSYWDYCVRLVHQLWPDTEHWANS